MKNEKTMESDQKVKLKVTKKKKPKTNQKPKTKN